ncbi:MAG: porin [Desulfuromusa sp.]
MMEQLKRKIMFCSILGVTLFMFGVGSAYAVTVKLSGQVNRAVMWADNGNDSELFHVDNDNSSTRFRLTGMEEFSKNFKVGVVWETQFESNTSSGVDIGQDSDGSSTFTERKLEIWFGTNYGKLWIGQGDGAANGSSEVDLSGTSVIMYSGVNDTAGGLTFRNSAGAIGPRIGQTRSNFDGLSRNDRLRYDTPTFGGVTLSASTTNGDAWELAGRWGQEFDNVGKFSAAIGYVDSSQRSDPGFQQIGASVSWLHSSGLNLTLAGGNRDYDTSNSSPGNSGRDSTNFYTKLGYTKGIHAVAIEYGQTEDLNQEGDESDNWGLAYVVKPWKGVELYSAYRSYSLDRAGTDYDDINQVMVGTRVKF